MRKGPGYNLFSEIKKQFGKLNIIAEDLGSITEGALGTVANLAVVPIRVCKVYYLSSNYSIDFFIHL